MSLGLLQLDRFQPLPSSSSTTMPYAALLRTLLHGFGARSLRAEDGASGLEASPLHAGHLSCPTGPADLHGLTCAEIRQPARTRPYCDHCCPSFREDSASPRRAQRGITPNSWPADLARALPALLNRGSNRAPVINQDLFALTGGATSTQLAFPTPQGGKSDVILQTALTGHGQIAG